MSGHAIDDKTGGIGGVHGGFTERLRPVEGGFGHVGSGGNAFDDFHQFHDVGWVEKVHPYYPFWVLKSGRDLGNGNAGGIGGEDGFWGVDGFQKAEQFAFDGQLFQDGFDDEIGHQGGAIWGSGQQREGGCGFFGRGFAFGYGDIELVLDVVLTFLQGGRMYIEQNGRVSGLDATQGDA